VVLSLFLDFHWHFFWPGFKNDNLNKGRGVGWA